MSAFSRPSTTRRARAFATITAIVGFALALAGADRAHASERVQDELKRKPVEYQSGGNCSGGNGCYRDLLVTPTGKKRIELSAITCTASSDGGSIVSVHMKRKDVTTDRSLELEVRYNGTWNSKKYYSATSAARIRLPKGTAYEVLAVSSTDVTYFKCTAIGDRITYSK